MVSQSDIIFSDGVLGAYVTFHRVPNECSMYLLMEIVPIISDPGHVCGEKRKALVCFFPQKEI